MRRRQGSTGPHVGSLAKALAGATLGVLLLAPAVAAARPTIVIKNMDVAGVGFNDKTAAAPVGGNPGKTVGEQRLIVFQYVASVWGVVLDSPVPIVVEATFKALPCTATAGTLGQAGTVSIYTDARLPEPSTWYPGALANALAGKDLDPPTAEISASFNSALGTAGCLDGQTWYLGLDMNAGGSQEDLASTVFHELAHGLGFETVVDSSTGAEQQDQGGSRLPDVFEKRIFDRTVGLHWHDMTASQRKASALNDQGLTWDGGRVKAAAPARMAHVLYGRLAAPAAGGQFSISEATYGPTVPAEGLTGTLARAVSADGTGKTNGCAAVAPLRGTLALVDRGDCTFAMKTANLQAAGAQLVVVVDRDGGSLGAGVTLSGDPSVAIAIRIPTIGVPRDDGLRLVQAVAQGQATLALTRDARLYGLDVDGRLLLFAPAELVVGSSVSHWDSRAFPNLLMEPSSNQGTLQDLDVTPEALADLGWRVRTGAALAMTKTGTLQVRAGLPAVYLLTIFNRSDEDLEGAVLTMATPTGMTFQAASGACTTAPPCAVGKVPRHSGATVALTYDVPVTYVAPTTVVATASLAATAASGPFTDTATVSSELVRDADVAVTVSAAAQLQVGVDATFEVKVVNQGPTDAANVVVSAVAPLGLTFKAAAGDCATARCTFATLAPGESRTYRLTYSVAGDFSGGGAWGLTVTAQSDTPDPDASNNSFRRTFKVLAADGGCAVVDRRGEPVALLGVLLFLLGRRWKRGPRPA